MIPEYHFDRITLGPIELRVFGTLVVLGILTGHTLFVRRARRAQLGAPAVIEGFAVSLGAGALLPEGKTIGPKELWVGRPAKLVRELPEPALIGMRMGVAHYVENGKAHAKAVAGS